MCRIGVAAALLVLAACERYETAVANRMQPWIGKPVRQFAARYSVAPTSVESTVDGGRTYIYRLPGPVGGSCGVTIEAGPRRDEFYINEMISDCPPSRL